MEVLVIKRYSELAEDIKPIAMQNYIDGYCAYTDPDGEITAEDIEENRIAFAPDGEIVGEYRICSKCGDLMIDGYIVFEDYYCSDECLHKDYSQEEYERLYEEYEDDINNYVFYTQWY